MIVLIILNLVFWFLLFFKSKKMVRTVKKTGDFYWEKKYSPWVETEERYRFPMWLFLVGTLAMLLPPLATIIYFMGHVFWCIYSQSSDFDSGYLELERPKLYIQTFLFKKV